MFSESELAQKVKTVLTQNESMIPAGHNGAIVADVDTDQIRFVIATKAKDGWDVNFHSAYHYKGNHDVDLGVTIVKTF